MPQNNKNIPTVISKAIKNDQLHVFLINGPTSLIVSRMIIDDYGIKSNNLFISCMRNTDTSLIYPAEFLPNEYWYDRYFEKVFGIRLKALRILRKILEKNKNFILYYSWAELGTEKIIESKRSRIPPCPSNILPESLTPASLFNDDSIKSPTCPNTPINKPIKIALLSENILPKILKV